MSRLRIARGPTAWTAVGIGADPAPLTPCVGNRAQHRGPALSRV
jgi:hypothetical protein